MRFPLRRFFPLALLLALPLPAFAQTPPLAARVPQDALLYIGWRGTTALGPAFDQSNLKGVMDAGFREQFTNLLQQIIAKAAKDDPTKADNAKTIAALADLLWTHPTAFYVGAPDVVAGKPPAPRLTLLCEAGNDAAALLPQLQHLITLRPNANNDLPVAAKIIDKYLVLEVGQPDATEALLQADANPAANNLSVNPDFVAALNQADPQAALTVYADVASMINVATQSMGQRGMGQGLEAFNVHAFKQLLLTGNFVDKNWQTQIFISLNEDRSMLARFLDNPPLTPDILASIPKDSVFAATFHFDGLTFLQDLRAMADKMMPNRGAAEMDQGLQRAGMFMGGINIEKDLLGAFGDQWLFYATPDAAGKSLKQTALINKLRDENAALKSFEILQDFANGRLAMEGPGADNFTRTEKDGLTMHTYALPQASPSWSIKNGYLAIAPSPEGVAAALAAKADKPGAGLGQNEIFETERKHLGVESFSTLYFIDLVKTAPEAYAILDETQHRMAEQAAEGEPILGPLPPLEKIQPFLSPVLALTWTDPAGWHMKSTEPFPGATLLAPQNAVMQIWSLNSMHQARGQARAVASMSNLRQIGMACVIYSQDKGQLPPDLGALVADGSLLRRFVYPDVNIPAEIEKGTKEEQSAWINKNSSYEYLGAGKKMADITNPSTTILAHEKLDLPTSKEKVNILFVDGHVESLERVKAEELINAAK